MRLVNHGSLFIYFTGLKQTWEFYRENKAVCGKTFMNSHKLNGESTRNTLLNEAVYLCAIGTGHSFQRRIIVNLFHWNEWPFGIAHNHTYSLIQKYIGGTLAV